MRAVESYEIPYSTYIGNAYSALRYLLHTHSYVYMRNTVNLRAVMAAKDK